MLALDFSKTTIPVEGKATPAVVVPQAPKSEQAVLFARLRLERIEALNRAMQVDNELYVNERKAFVYDLAALEKR